MTPLSPDHPPKRPRGRPRKAVPPHPLLNLTWDAPAAPKQSENSGSGVPPLAPLSAKNKRRDAASTLPTPADSATSTVQKRRVTEVGNGGSRVPISDMTETGVVQTGPQGREFTYVDIGSIDRDTKRIAYPKILPSSNAPSRAKQVLKTGDVLVSMTRPNLNAVALVPPDLDGAIGSTGFHILRAHDAEPGFLFYAVQTPEFIDAMCLKVQGALYPAVRPRDISSFCVPVLSLVQQHRIVAEIEKQFTRLEAGVAALRRVQANLKRYRAAVLKAACEGRLVPTEAELAKQSGSGVPPLAPSPSRQDKRRDAASTYETGGQLLARILAERKAKVAAVSRRSFGSSNDKRRDAASTDSANLPPLPEGWTWATAEQLTDENRSITYGVIKLGAPVSNGVHVLRSSDVRHLRLDMEDVKRVAPEIAADYRRTFLQGGEVLITVRGTLGGVVVAPPECAGFNISREVAMLAMVEPAIAKTVAIFIGSAPLQRWLLHRAKGIAYTGINIETLKELPIPLPPLAEQTRIVAEVERRLSVVEELGTVVAANLARAARLRQAILQRAFSGGL